MRTFDEYLTELRKRLEVGPRRAQEICAEARCHLEAQAQQFEQQGLGHDEAVAKAIAAFGEPAAVAEVLTKSNGHHRRAQTARAVGLGVAIGAAVSYAGTAVLWLAGATESWVLTADWCGTLMPGAVFGGLCALLVSAWRVRLRWIVITLAAAPALLLAAWLSLLLRAGGSFDASLLLRGNLGVIADPAICAAIALAVAWAVYRWVLRAPAEPSAPMKPAAE